MKILLIATLLFSGIFVGNAFCEDFRSWDRLMPSEERFAIVMSGGGVLDRETGRLGEKY